MFHAARLFFSCSCLLYTGRVYNYFIYHPVVLRNKRIKCRQQNYTYIICSTYLCTIFQPQRATFRLKYFIHIERLYKIALQLLIAISIIKIFGINTSTYCKQQHVFPKSLILRSQRMSIMQRYISFLRFFKSILALRWKFVVEICCINKC